MARLSEEIFIRLQKDIFQLLLREIDSQYVYHNVNHALDVLEAVIIIAQHEKLSPYETLLLKTAALLHDIGFIEKYDDNEEICSQIAGEILPNYDYNQNDIAIIQHMILNTAFPSNPQDLLSQVLCDADLDYLGRDDYWNKSMLLYREWNTFKRNYSLREWYELQSDFLSQHKYFCSFSRTYREPKKLIILKNINQLLNKYF